MLSTDVSSVPATCVPVLTEFVASSRLNALSLVDAAISVLMMFSGSATTSTHVASTPKLERTTLNDASSCSPTLRGRSCGANPVVAMAPDLTGRAPAHPSHLHPAH